MVVHLSQCPAACHQSGGECQSRVEPRGIGVAATYNLNRWFGLTADFSGTLWGSGENPAQLSILDDSNFYNVSFWSQDHPSPQTFLPPSLRACSVGIG